MQRNYFSWFSTHIHCKNYLSRSHSSKKFQDFSTTFRKHYNITVKVSAPISKHNSPKKLDSFIHGIKQGLLKTAARFVLWSWNFYNELLYLLLHHCPKIRTRTCIQHEIQIKATYFCILNRAKTIEKMKKFM